MRSIKLRTDALTILNIIHDRNSGLPKSREAHGNGDHRSSRGGHVPSGRLGKPATGRRGSGTVLEKTMKGMRNAES